MGSAGFDCGSLVTDAEVQHGTGAESDLGVARFEAALADERALLVADKAADLILEDRA